MAITFDSYDLNDSDLELIRVQYRLIGGNGAWINIAEIPKDSLGELFETIYWNNKPLNDFRQFFRFAYHW